MTKYTLCGGGIHDDTPALLELLDSGTAEVYLPAPAAFYSICKTLKLHAGQTLRMAPTTHIRLAADSNCCMVENADFSQWAENICIDGGVWDFNNVEQEPNPYHFPGKDGKKFYAKLGMTDMVQGYTKNYDVFGTVFFYRRNIIPRFCKKARF